MLLLGRPPDLRNERRGEGERYTRPPADRNSAASRKDSRASGKRGASIYQACGTTGQILS